MLILFRGIQGLGAGALFPIALAVIGDLFTPGRARQVPGPLRGRVRDLVRHRPAPRRLPDRQRQLALDLLRQHPDRASSACSSSGGSCRRSSEPSATRNLDYLGARVFTVAISVPAGRPDQQAVRRLDRPDRRRLHRASALVGSAALRRSSRRGPRSRSSRSTCSATGPTSRRSSRRSSSASGSSARSSSCRAGSSSCSGSSADRVRLPDLPAADRPDRQLDRLRHRSSRGPAATRLIVLAGLGADGRRASR